MRPGRRSPCCCPTLRRPCALLRLGSSEESRWSFLEQAFGEHDLDNARHGLRASPVALQLARERDPTDRLAAGLHDTLEAGAMRLEGGTADRIDDRIDVVTLPQRVERGEGHTNLRPERAEDELAPARGPHGANE